MASTSSVYGANTEMPFDERQKGDAPMSLHAATKKANEAMRAGAPIEVYNHGHMSRDFTYIDDLVRGITGLIEAVPGDTPVSNCDSLSPVAPFRIVTVGASRPPR